MTIGVDGNEANVRHSVGVSVYTLNLLKYFHSHATSDIRFKIYLREQPRENLPAENEFFTYQVVKGKRMWSTIFLPLHLWLYKLSGKKLDVFFSPAHYIPRFCPFKTVVTIHDLSYLFFPGEFLKKDLYQLKNWTLYALEKAAQVIAVSKTTKKDILKEYGLPEGRIRVIYNGYESAPLSHKSHINPITKNPYFLYVGTIQPRKNISLLIDAFAQFHKENPSFKLIVAGKKGWLYDDIFRQASLLHMNDSIIFPGFVSEDEKIQLYKGAQAYILPSLYEGFGIPLLEAMSHGCPVIASFSSSLPEIGGEACLYFDPNSVDDLLEKMQLIASDSGLTTKLIAKGRERITSFSWEIAGKETLELLCATAQSP